MPKGLDGDDQVFFSLKFTVTSRGERMVDEIEELLISGSESMEDLFSEALANVEEAMKSVDRMHHAGVSPLTPPCWEKNN